MTLKCTPFLLFDGNCAEAMTFYHRCLGGELTLTKLGDSSMREQLPREKHERIINAYLKAVPSKYRPRTGWPHPPLILCRGIHLPSLSLVINLTS
jgi:PhnB protein